MTTPARMRILLIEDHRDLAENIGDYLTPKGYVVDYAHDGPSGLRRALSGEFDAIVLDLMLPGLDGTEVCRRLRLEGKSDTPVLMLTARDRIDDKVKGFDVGADDYLVKPFALKELEARLKALHRRASGVHGSRILQVADLKFDPDTFLVQRGNQRIDLNPTARTLLALLMRRSPKLVTRDELEHAIWGDERPDGDILRAHMHSLRASIDKPFATRLLHTVRGLGYRLAEESDTDD